MNISKSARLAPVVGATSAKFAPVKTFASATRTNTTNVLDNLSPALAPFAARWDAEADRRHALRTPENLKKLMEAQKNHTSARSTAAQAKAQRSAAKAASKNPLGAARRSAATADKAARKHRGSARTALKAARTNYPATLRRRAVEAHAVHAVPAGIATWAASTPADWTVWPAATSAALIAANVAGLWLGRRTSTTPVEEGVSAEERALMERLHPTYWVHHADGRGLAGTVTTPPQMTPAGIVCEVRLDGKWTSARELAAKGDAVRALLGMKTGTRMEIGKGSQGDWARIIIRTRSATDGINLEGWEPGAPWGVNTITGEPVMVPLGRRMLVAGTSGSGKSWSTRALLAEASEYVDHRLVVIDPKRVEAINWEHRARIAIQAEDVLDVTDDLVAEMHERLQLIPRGEDVIAISADRPRITVFVDEGAEVIAMARKKRVKGTEDEPGDPDWSRIMENFSTLARMARAAEIILIWATQKPTMDAKGGIDPQIAAQITYRAALALSTSGESRVVFGEDATEKGWHGHELPMPGVALLRSGPTVKPEPIRTRAFSPKHVIGLPDRVVWSREFAPANVPADPPPPLRLVKKSAAEVPAARPAPVSAPATNRDRVLHAVRDGARTNRDVIDRTGINKGSVSKLLKALIESGDVVKDADAGLVLGTTGTEEVSA
ncbi:ATP-binding protein [Streptomyces sp. MBT67]|uniref:MarR family transcriptional regulator n=3 Tax=unclassified Streptomyces TaxID=2593676 RepID=UPI00190B23A6|nr:helix-turn-helix domain-containing protein [Streptomyces sp. MBT67]MBK3539628.1 ATP-binding protein [Streptomyces sp. MBT67]